MKRLKDLLRSNRLRLLLLLGVLLFLPYVSSRILSPWRMLQVDDLSREPNSEAVDSQIRNTNELSIACYNIAHGRGIAESNWGNDTAKVRTQRLDEIANLLIEVDADIVVLNEVDFDSSWS
ncbi:MAG: hypothetical protein AAF394_02035, partial [Planctomycetota bacterium]